MSVIEEKETSIDTIKGRTRENGYFKEFSETVEERVHMLKNALERAEDFMDTDTIISASKKLNDIKMGVEELIGCGEKSQENLSETVLNGLGELERKKARLIAQLDMEQDYKPVEQNDKYKDTPRMIEVDGNTIASLQEAERQVRNQTKEADNMIRELQNMLNQPDITDAQKENLQGILESMLIARENIGSALESLNKGNTILGISKPLDEQQKDLEEIVSKESVNIEEKNIKKQLAEEERLQSPQEVGTLYEDLRKRIQALGGLQSAGRHVRTIRSIERDIARLEDFLANSSNLGIDLNGLKQTLDTVKAELTLKQDSVDRDPYESEKGASVEQNIENSTRNYRRNRRDRITEDYDPFIG